MALKFWTHVDKAGPLSSDPLSRVSSNCWIWTGGTDGGDRERYGRYLNQSAHRVAYESEVGTIPKGMDLDHLCRVRLCVRPDHLEPVTRRENLLRSNHTVTYQNSVKTHCDNGHELTESNTYRRPDRPSRECRTCRNAAGQRSKRRNRVGC